MNDDWEYCDECCPKCHAQMAMTNCWQCGGEGAFDGYEEYPLWYDEGDVYLCDECRGNGALIWCRECGWDYTFKRFLNDNASKTSSMPESK
jgi:DnaJ-class molecular chaperone